MSIKEVRKSKADSTWLSHKLYYRNNFGKKDSIKVDLKSRGNFRLNECYLPPLWIKIPKKRAAGTLFQGNKKVKLVLPCNNQKGSNDLILREYICYKLCELITPFAFKTRLVNIDLTELRGKKDKNFQVKGIMIEDLEKWPNTSMRRGKGCKNLSIRFGGYQRPALLFFSIPHLKYRLVGDTAAQHKIDTTTQR
jgi:hypothetical protein